MDNLIAYRQFVNRQQLKNTTTLRSLKVGVWLYFLLLIFEGALRKWFLPALSTPLLIVRDPIALWVVITALNRKIIRLDFYNLSILIISIIAFFTAVTIGHGNIPVAVFGVRILIVHFPFMFAIGKIFNHEDVEKLGKATLWISLPMVVLTGLQFYSPQSAWVNRGVGGDESGAGFQGALGFFRPPGTFSFTNGNALFFAFTSVFIFYFLLQPNKINKTLLICSGIALIASVPISISRTLIFSITVSAIFMLLALSRKPEYTGRVIFGIIGVFVLFSLISQFSFFQTATDAFTDRFTSANKTEGGLQGVFLDRYMGGMIGAISNSYQIPFFGLGIGMGTNVGSQILTGKLNFLISEGEWGRLIGEMGLLMGLLMIMIRLIFCLQLTQMAYKRLAKNDVLPWMILSFTLLIVPQGQWSQPTSLGFSTLAGGLVLASLNRKTN